ncbi:carbon storage regulator CsrA [Jonesiaceae bacterium BS-20]|uniref:Translational regulator CsrA n=1 Tax=Jonesiaceae bacterium BS-20 TaxID=3120821 RepID=A0AAU7DWR1_9MICO
MLVLSRRVGEKLLIGDDIEVVILDSRGDGVRIGINAPRSTKIHRAEVVEAVKAANESAALSAATKTEGAQALSSMLAAKQAGADSSTPSSPKIL